MNIFSKRTVICSFLISFVCAQLTLLGSVIDEKTALDLEILPHSSHQSLYTILDQTTTLYGKECLKNMLSYPLYNVEVLNNRQRCSLLFIEKKDLTQTIKSHLSLLASHEKALKITPGQEGLISGPALEGVYFSSPHLQKYNSSPAALNAGYIMHVAGLCLPLAEYLILHTSIGMLFSLEHDHSTCGGHHVTPESGNLKYYGAQGAILGCHIPSLYEMAGAIKQRALITKHLQQQMIHARNYLKHAKAIYMLLKEEPSINGSQPLLILKEFFGKVTACQFQEFMNHLDSPTFSGDASLINHVGKVLAAYKLYTNLSQEFLMVGQALGEIDLYLSVACLVDNQTEDAPWCFADYKDAAAPFLKAENVRHLFLQSGTVKTSQVTCTESAHTIITGDNGSGKSTYINGLGHALVLAQSLGIAPAQKFELTPFSHICTYRFIQDNIFEGTSRFYAECARIENILETIEQAPGFCCVLLDEPFTSTHAVKGCNHLQDTLKRLFSTQHVISFTATHYHALNKLIDEYTKTHSMHLA